MPAYARKDEVSLSRSHNVKFPIKGFAGNRTDGRERPFHGVFNFLIVCIFSTMTAFL